MTKFEVHTTMPYPIHDVFAHTVDLENAPRWHSFFTDVQQLTPNPIGIGSRWNMRYRRGSFDLEMILYEPPNRVAFRGSPVFGITPRFTITFRDIGEGTLLTYRLHPDVPILLKPVIAILAPPYGRRDLARYFSELNVTLAQG